MAKRDMKKTASKMRGVKNDYYSISVQELTELKDMIMNGEVYEALSICFDYGFVLGARAQKVGKYTEKKATISC